MHLSHEWQRVISIGTAELQDTNGARLRSDDRQPLFYVEHAVGGRDSRPLSLSRVVQLTHGTDRALMERCAGLQDQRALPEFIEEYVQRDLHVALSKREVTPAGLACHLNQTSPGERRNQKREVDAESVPCPGG